MDNPKKISTNNFSGFIFEFRNLQKKIRKIGKKQLFSNLLKDEIKSLVKLYFSETKTQIDNKDCSAPELEEKLQELFALSCKNSIGPKYLSLIKDIIEKLNNIELKLECGLGESMDLSSHGTNQPSVVEEKIIDTLNQISENLGNSYKQIFLDINDPERISFKGTAAEMREIVRGVLNNLAPDEEVKNQKNFKLETNCDKPTMRQKAVFILKARSQDSKGIKLTEDYISIIEDSVSKIGSAVRSVYSKGSVNTHTDINNETSACRQYKMYVDAILGELLEIYRKQ